MNDPGSPSMTSNRQPAVAGYFYPADPNLLTVKVEEHLSRAEPLDLCPKILIAPHAGYDYSGPTAGVAFRQLEGCRGSVTRVVLLGPSHHHWFAGIATTSADSYVTPLGEVPIDREAYRAIEDLPQIQQLDAAHSREHSLEVELPFLQRMLDDFSIVPLVLSDVTSREVAEVLDRLWGGEETLIVVSSDLSHYLPYDRAREIDSDTARRIEHEDSDLDATRACGYQSINGALDAAREHGLEVRTLDLRNSGDTAGSRERVVGYGAFALR